MNSNSLFDETGLFFFSRFGRYEALVFQGDIQFFNRCFNLCKNFGIMNTGRWHTSTNINKQDIKYILTNKDNVLRGLSEYFRWEVITGDQRKYINYKVETDQEENIIVSWNEEKVDQLAKVMADNFWNKKIIIENVIYKFQSSVVEDFSVSRNHKNKNISY